jgi:hypothetical protein
MSLPIIVIDGFIFWPKLTGSPCGAIYFDGYARYTQRRIWTDGDTTKQLQGLLHARLRQYFDGRLRTLARCRFIIHKAPWCSINADLIRLHLPEPLFQIHYGGYQACHIFSAGFCRTLLFTGMIRRTNAFI